MIIEQILVTKMSVFCYLIANRKNGEGLLLDPAGDFDKIFNVVKKHNVKIKYVVNSHGHFDHTSGNSEVLKRTGAELLIHQYDAKMLGSMMNGIMSRTTGGKGSPKASRLLNDGDLIQLGSLKIKVIHTPGHTEGSISLFINGNLFTGDTLFTEGYGRTDFTGGSHKKLMDSILNKILKLPDSTIIWPGHNYGRFPKSTVKFQKKMYLN